MLRRKRNNRLGMRRRRPRHAPGTAPHPDREARAREEEQQQQCGTARVVGPRRRASRPARAPERTELIERGRNSDPIAANNKEGGRKKQPPGQVRSPAPAAGAKQQKTERQDSRAEVEEDRPR